MKLENLKARMRKDVKLDVVDVLLSLHSTCPFIHIRIHTRPHTFSLSHHLQQHHIAPNSACPAHHPKSSLKDEPTSAIPHVPTRLKKKKLFPFSALSPPNSPWRHSSSRYRLRSMTTAPAQCTQTHLTKNIRAARNPSTASPRTETSRMIVPAFPTL